MRDCVFPTLHSGLYSTCFLERRLERLSACVSQLPQLRMDSFVYGQLEVLEVLPGPAQGIAIKNSAFAAAG
jgi:hypothetical protein